MNNSEETNGIKRDGNDTTEEGQAKPKRPPVGKETGELVAAMGGDERFADRPRDHLEDVARLARDAKKGFDARRFQARAQNPGGPPTVTLPAPTRPTPKVVIDDPQLVISTQSWGWLWGVLAALAIATYFLVALATEGAWPLGQ